ncbi:MAG: hypothetical protein ACHQM6_00740 [Candidatus Kapaibacterium sp.]
MQKTLMIVAAMLAFAAAVNAQETKQTATKAATGAMLHPEMMVAQDAGNYQKPAGILGEKPEQVWSTTTTAAGVGGKPNAGKAVCVTGEIIDLSCYLQLGKHGEKHIACGKKCLTNGQPIGLLDKKGSVYMLMEEEHDPRRDGQVAGFRKAAIEHFGQIMQVSGTQSTVNGYRAIYVQGYVSK